jgi:hypothetical protein
MMQEATAMTLGVRASDVSGQRTVRASAISPDATVGDLVRGLLSKMRLPRNDSAGRPLTYRARLEREGRHLNGGERVGECLRDDDHTLLQPNIDAGAGRDREPSDAS